MKKKPEEIDPPETTDDYTADTPLSDEIYVNIYPDLLRIARSQLRNNRDLTLTTRSLAQDAWIRLRQYPELAALPDDQLKRIAAKYTRRVLFDHARHHNATKRGEDAVRLPLDESIVESIVSPGGLSMEVSIDLHRAFDRLAEVAPRKAEVLGLRTFGGYHEAEIAEILKISPTTVQKDYRMARAWLNKELSQGKNDT